MKKLAMGITAVGIGLLVLAGCTSNNRENEKQVKSQNTVQVSESYSKVKKAEMTSSTARKTTEQTSTLATTKSKESRSAQKDSLWDSQKASELQSFMTSWGQTMGQTYEAYQPENNVDFYGVELPDAVLGTAPKQPVAVNDQIVSAKWSESGQKTADYSIVAVYSDAKTAPFAAKHVYFFGFHDEQPVTLVSMQNQGMPDGALHFKPTENQALTSGFQSIANNKAGNTSSSTSETKPTSTTNNWASMDEAIEFYEATYKNSENEISKEIIWDNYDRKCWSLTEQSGNKIVLHWANISGAGGSYDAFIKNGDTTQLIVYDGNMSYPNKPSATYTIQNSDHKVIKTE